MSTKSTGKPRRYTPEGRRSARLAAVQALYEMEFTDTPLDTVILSYFDQRWRESVRDEAREEGIEDPKLPAHPDRELFVKVVKGAYRQRTDINAMIDGALSEGWTTDRLDPVLRAILQAGSFELLECPEIPPKVIINEYLEVAGGFFEGPESAMVNGVLDKLAKMLRASDLATS